MRGYDFSGLSKEAPLKSLTKGRHRKVGRNNHGRITNHHRGGGVKRLYRTIDFKQNKIDIPAKVASIEYDPNRTARIALLNYADGEKRYILAPMELKVGDTIITSEKAPLRGAQRVGRLARQPAGRVDSNSADRIGEHRPQ